MERIHLKITEHQCDRLVGALAKIAEVIRYTDLFFDQHHSIICDEGITLKIRQHKGTDCDNTFSLVLSIPRRERHDGTIFDGEETSIDISATKVVHCILHDIPDEFLEKLGIETSKHDEKRYEYIGMVETVSGKFKFAEDLFLEISRVEYLDEMDFELLFEYETEEQKTAFDELLKKHRMMGMVLEKNRYQRLVDAIKAEEELNNPPPPDNDRDIDLSKIADLLAEDKEDKAELAWKEDIATYKKIIGLADNLDELRDKIADYERYKGLRSGYKERIVPTDFHDKAKYILQNLKVDRERVAASDLYNEGKKPNERGYKYFGISRDDYRCILRDYDELQSLFSSTLKKHYALFVEIFLNGLSLQEYATKLGKGKSTIDHRVNNLYNDLAAEYDRLSHIERTEPQYPSFDDLKPAQQSAIHDAINLRLALGNRRYNELVARGANIILDDFDKHDKNTQKKLREFLSQLLD